MPSMSEAAVWYAKEKGFPVFPCHWVVEGRCSCGDPECGSPGKHPKISGGVNSASTDVDQIREWWAKWPDANVALAMGGVVGLDVDENGEETLGGFAPIVDTPEVRTPKGGSHLYLADPGIPLKNGVRFMPGLDLRTKGGYLLAPPSKTPDGEYKWVHKLNGHFAPCPDWLIEKCRADAPKETKEPAIVGAEVEKGYRNDSLFRFACRLRRNGLDALEIMGSLMAINRTRCNPPLTETELGKIAESAAKYQAMPTDLQDTTVDVPEEARSGWIGEFQTEGIRTGCASGIGFIDDNTQVGGFSDAQMSVISAYTGFGKTTFMLQCALNVARRKETVGYVTFADFTAADLYDRLVTMVSGWKGRTPPSMSDELYNLWLEARHEVATLPIIVYDASESKAGRSVERYAEWMQKYPQMRICFNDYAQEMRSDNPRVRGQFEHAEECCGILRWLAATTKIPIVVGSQLTEGNEKAGTRDTTKGSRVWEERCALHMKIRRFTEKELAKLDQEYATIPGIAEWNIVKNRHGKSMIRTYAQFSEKYLRFIEL